ncbi:helix-turn-helix domain-containing protein [Methylobacillus sp. Pita1]|uniref:AraC family transcriptional regulator n=1 Tax=Methylobacillus sp. Pita1 TaxID=3382642 RepID=UPI0038B5F336
MLTAYPTHLRIFLWPGKVLYFGPSPPLGQHLYGAAAIHVGIYKPFQIRINREDPLACSCAIIPPGVNHEIDFGNGIHGKMFVEMDSPEFQLLRQRFPYRTHSATTFHDAGLVDCFRSIYEDDPTKGEVDARLNHLLGEASSRHAIDPRIQAAIEIMRNEPDRNFPNEYLAAAVDLSPSRFLHLFKAETGNPYRRFRRWKRLLTAAGQFHQADNMTHVALNNGFTDSAHFSNCFHQSFGVQPSFVFRAIERFEMIA